MADAQSSSGDSVTIRLDKPWSQFTDAEKDALLNEVAGRVFPDENTDEGG